MTRQLVDLDWTTGQVPVSACFDNRYFSLDNGLAETTRVFLTGNNLPACFATYTAAGFSVTRTKGFGRKRHMTCAKLIGAC